MQRIVLLITATVLSLATACLAELSMPSIFSDHMVLQREKAVNVFGRDNPGQTVTVRLDKQQKQAVAGADGRWQVALDAMPAGGPYEMQVDGSSSRRIKDVLLGEVWICSGQSNMQFNLGSVLNAQQEIATADNPKIRLLQIPMVRNAKPQDDVKAAWTLCTPQTAFGFSGVGYFFGRQLNKDLDVPVGLINSSWGGTAAEAWTAREDLVTVPGMRESLEAAAISEEEGWPQYAQKMQAWLTSVGLANQGGERLKSGWASANFDDSAWQAMELPTYWQTKGLQFNGAIWFRRTVDIPADADLSNAILELGAIDDFDVTCVNGQEVGSTSADTIKFWSAPRKYKLGEGLLQPGRNVIAVRVLDIAGYGGFAGPAAAMKLTLGQQSLPLTGPWKYQVELRFAISPDNPRPVAPGPSTNMATELYNAMIHPLIAYNIRGAIWYQGETNAGDPKTYGKLLPAMIHGWRQRWHDEFPFLIVQLAGFMPNDQTADDNSGWAQFRDVQREIAEKTPRCGLAVAVDIGDMNDIHPKNKQDVGKRLAIQAMNVAYGKKIVASGPTFGGLKSEGDKLIVSFTNVGGGLVARNDNLVKSFAIQDITGRWVWADARIVGNTVVLTAPDAPQPVAVRYAWQNTPAANLYNKEGLPAVPFQAKLP